MTKNTPKNVIDITDRLRQVPEDTAGEINTVNRNERMKLTRRGKVALIGAAGLFAAGALGMSSYRPHTTDSIRPKEIPATPLEVPAISRRGDGLQSLAERLKHKYHSPESVEDIAEEIQAANGGSDIVPFPSGIQVKIDVPARKARAVIQERQNQQ